MTKKKWLRILGGLIVFAGLLGFLTVADDLRHTGELWGMVSLLAAGICLFLAGYKTSLSQWLALEWLAAGFAAAIPVGSWMDNMPAGIALGVVFGIVVGYLRRGKPAQPGE